jgi:hypothetical protein
MWRLQAVALLLGLELDCTEFCCLVGFDVLTAVVMKSTIFWDTTPCSPLSVNRRFGVTHHLHLQDRKNKLSKKPAWKQVCVSHRASDVTAPFFTDCRSLVALSFAGGYPVAMAPVWRREECTPKGRRDQSTKWPLWIPFIHKIIHK